MIQSPAGWAAVAAIESGRSMRSVLLDQGEEMVGALRARGQLVPRAGGLPPLDFTRPPLEVPVKQAHPAPLVPRREAHQVEIPSAARTVRKLAEGCGWRVTATYALGWTLDARGKVHRLTHSVALRMRWQRVPAGVARHLVAVWIVPEDSALMAEEVASAHRDGTVAVAVPVKGWKFDLAYGWGAGHAIHKLSAAALKESIKEA